MLGLDVYNGSQTQLALYKSVAKVTFPLLQKAGDITHSFSREDLIVVGQDGIVRYYGRVGSAHARQEAIEVINALLHNRPLLEPITGSLFFDRKIPFGETRSTQVTLKNIGSGSLEVTDIQTETGTFTSPDLPITIPPGESQKITVVFTADGTDDVLGDLTFISNANTISASITPIEITNLPEPAISIQQTTINFGTFDHARTQQQTLTIQNTGQGPLTITQIQSDLSQITVSPSNKTIAPGESATVAILLQTSEEGQISGTLQIMSNDTTQPTITLSLFGTAQTIPANPQADVNGNGTVDFPDFLTFAQVFGQAHSTLDFNNNGTVDFPDFLTFVQSFGKSIN